MCQRRWLELLKIMIVPFNIIVGKMNVVVDVLSRRSYAFTSAMLLTQRLISYDLQMMKIELKTLGTHVKITNIRV